MDRVARTQKQLGAALRSQRKHLGLTQKTLAEKISSRQATVSDLEKGDRDSRLQTVFELLAALDLELVIRPRTRGDTADLEAIF